MQALSRHAWLPALAHYGPFPCTLHERKPKRTHAVTHGRRITCAYVHGEKYECMPHATLRLDLVLNNTF